MSFELKLTPRPHQILEDKWVLIFAAAVTFLSILLCFINLFASALLLILLAAGLFFPFLFFSKRLHVPNLLALFISPTNPCAQRERNRSCSICGSEECQRQHSSTVVNTSAHAHTHFYIPQSVDDAIEELMNLVLDHHVYSWYKEMMIHDQLADEIRLIIRHAACAIGTRLFKVDLTVVILHRLVPAMISHLDAYLDGRCKLKGGSTIEAAVIKHLKDKDGLHIALESREEEINYLRGVVCAAIPYLVPSKYAKSRLARLFMEELLGKFLILQGLDLLANPDTVNLLFLLLLSGEHTLDETSSKPENSVLLLKNFSSVNTQPRKSIYRSDLSCVLKDQTLLYLFHTFLKEEGAINILQFCLAVEDFNRHILDPELTPEQMEKFHKDALLLYHTYMVPSAVDKLNFEPDIIQQIKDIVHGGASDIVKLRTTRPLYQAYEYAYNLLAVEYMPLFMNSNAYFGHLCGTKGSQGLPKNSTRDGNSNLSHPVRVGKVVKKVGSGLKHIGKQIAMKPAVIVGDEYFQSDDSVDEGEDITSYMLADEGANLNESRGKLESLTQAFRDLSAWRVTVPRVESRKDSMGKASFIFIVDVKRVDVTGENPEDLQWEVERKFQEFYVLEAKLTEFHGEFPVTLPPRRSLFTSKGLDFMNHRRKIFEEFLQNLCRRSFLKGSQLLFLFLKTKDEFTASYLPDVSLGRLLRDVPRKLLKERGQYLEPFITDFISSTDTDNIAKPMFDLIDISFVDDDHLLTANIPELKMIKGSIFRNNVQSLKLLSSSGSAISHNQFINVSGVVETVLYVAVRAYGVSLNVLRWAVALQALIGNTIDAAVARFLRSKLSQALCAPNIVKLVHLIRDALFIDPPPYRTEEDIRRRRNAVRSEVEQLVPPWLVKWVSERESYLEGTNTLVSLFQHPVLNKQLSYVLLDIVLDELFPELQLEENIQIFSSLPR